MLLNPKMTLATIAMQPWVAMYSHCWTVKGFKGFWKPKEFWQTLKFSWVIKVIHKTLFRKLYIEGELTDLYNKHIVNQYKQIS